MNIYTPLLMTALAVTAGFAIQPAPAAAPIPKTPSASYQQHLVHAKQLIIEERWRDLESEALILQASAKQLTRRPGATENQYKARLDELDEYALKLATAARRENLEDASAHYSRLAACFRATVQDDPSVRWTSSSF